MFYKPRSVYHQETISSAQSLSHVWLFATPWTAAHQASWSTTSSRSLLKLMSIESVMTYLYITAFEHKFTKAFLSWFFNSPLKWFQLIVSLCVLVTQSCPTLCDPMDCTARQALLSMGFSRQGYWSGLPFPSPGDIPSPGIKLGSPALQADALLSELLVSMSHENVSSYILCDLIARKKKDNNLFPELFKAYSDWRMSFLFSSSCLSCYIGILCLK